MPIFFLTMPSRNNRVNRRGFMIVDDLLKNDTFSIRGHKFVVSNENELVSFPLSLLGVARTLLRREIVMFHVLAGKRPDGYTDASDKARILEGASYVMEMSNAILTEVTGRRPLTPQETAIMKVADFFWDIIGVPPLLSVAANIGIPSVRIVIARATHLMGILYGSTAKTYAAVNRIVNDVWNIQRGTPFFAVFMSVLYGCDIPVKWVQLGDTPDRQPLRPRSHLSPYRLLPVSATIDNTVGMLMTPNDKLTLAMVLLFSEQHNKTVISDSTKESGSGYPPIIVEIAQKYRLASTTGLQPPWYYGRNPTMELH